MPQMAPIAWLTLFIVFSVTFIIFNTMNYYSFFSTMPKTTMIMKSKKNSLNWKW